MTAIFFLHILLATDAPSSLKFTGAGIPLPGADGAVSLDYLAADRIGGRVWIPAGNTGSVDVLDVASKKVTVAHVGDKGTLTALGTASTAEGARVVVVAGDGTAVVADPNHGRVLMLSPLH